MNLIKQISTEWDDKPDSFIVTVTLGELRELREEIEELKQHIKDLKGFKTHYLKKVR